MYYCTPKALYNHIRGLSSTTTNVKLHFKASKFLPQDCVCVSVQRVESVTHVSKQRDYLRRQVNPSNDI